ncbi:MAG: FliI/YscN family ATPase [Desulforhabdus sp.]|jgi:flagellum-specific ATP synthase|nr:FliI/YscN family ATPase [Desulforhabdus sp.]
MNSKLPDENYLGLVDILPSLDNCPRWQTHGKVVQLVGNLIEAEGMKATLGDICRINPSPGSTPIYAEVIGFNQKRLKLSPLTSLSGIHPGCLVQAPHQADCIPVSAAMLGRVLDGMGQPIDDGEPLPQGALYPISGNLANPLVRPVIKHQLDVGIRCVNGLLPIGKGQRIGIFAGSGVGKSTLLGMMARYTSASVNVIALIGERGREVNEFLLNDLGEEGLKRSVVVVATSDQPATVRLRGAFVACTIAEYFRDQGQDVLLMMDSLTRFAMAAREIGLAAGEPPTSKGYTPSVFSHMPRLLERAGNFEIASVTGVYTVLVEGDDMEEPIADASRSMLDGHIVLDRHLAQKRHFPAINVLRSVSRLTSRFQSGEYGEFATKFIQTLAHYYNSEDMIRIGAYLRGTHAETDYAITMIDKLHDYLRQSVEESCSIAEAKTALAKLFAASQ